MTRLQLVTIRNPFDRRERDVCAVELQRLVPLSEIVAQHFPAGVPVTVSLNGRVVSAGELAATFPSLGDQVVLLPQVHGGNTGKTILRAVIVIVATVVGALLGQYYLGPYMAGVMGGAAAGATAGAGIGAGVGSLVGGFIANAIIPPARPEVPSVDNMGSATYAWTPQNTQQQGLVVPRWYGVNKLYGNIIASNLESDGDKQYLNVLISLGLGPYKRLYDFQINDQPVYNLKGVEIHTKLGFLSQDPIEGFSSTKTEYPQYVKIPKASPFTYATVGNNFDGLEVDVTFPSGIWTADDQGNLVSYGVDFRIEVAPHGSGAWRSITTQVVEVERDVLVNEHWSYGFWSGEEDGAKIWVEIQSGGTDPHAHTEGEGSYDEQNYRYVFWRWVGEVITEMASVTRNYVTVKNDKTTALRRTFKAVGLAYGRYDVRVTKISADESTLRYGNDLYLTSVREVLSDEFTYPREVLVSIKALATDQLSGSLRFSCMAECALVRVYNGTSWSVALSDNPAWVLWDLLTQPVFNDDFTLARYDGIDPSRLDLGKWLEWAEFCSALVPDGDGGLESRITFNGGFDTEGNLWDAAMQVCQVGRAVPVWNGVHLTLAIDKPAEPTQLFSVGNIETDSFEEVFLPLADRAAEIEIDFLNSKNGYVRDKFSVVDADSDNKSNKVSLQLIGCNSPSQAWRAAQYRLACNKFLLRTVSWDADIDSIACSVGDVVLVQHDVPQWGAGGRLVSATANSVTLDREVVLEEGKSYTVMVRLSNDTLVTRNVSSAAGARTELTVATPFSPVPEVYDVYTFGEIDRVAKPFRVINIAPRGDLKRTLTGIEYNETLYGADTGEPVLPTPNYAPSDLLPVVTGLILTEQVGLSPTGALINEWFVSWDNPRSYFYAKAEVWAKWGGQWEKMGEVVAPEDSFSFPVKVAGATYHVAVVTVNNAGRRQSIQNSPQVSSNSEGPGKVVTPAMSGLSTSAGGTVFDGRDCTLRWDPANLAASIHGGYKVEILTTVGVLKRTTVVKDATWTYTFGMNFDDFGGAPAASFKVRVSTLSLVGAAGVAQTITVTNSLPAAPTSLSAAGQLLSVKLTAGYAVPEDFDFLEVWAAGVNNRASAALVGTSKTREFLHSGLAASAANFYWVRVVDRFAQAGGWYPASSTGGVAGPVVNDPAQLLQILSQQITDSQLAQSLSTSISNSASGIAVEQSVRGVTTGPNYDATKQYAPGQTVVYGGKVWQNKQAYTIGPWSWNQAQWTEVTASLYGQYTVKLDVNGYVSGFGMANDGSSSTFLVNADKFAVGKLGSTSILPFMISGGVVYMNSAVIRDADIGTLKLAGGSVNIDFSASAAGPVAIPSTNVETTLVSKVVSCPNAPQSTAVSCSFYVAVVTGTEFILHGKLYNGSTLIGECKDTVSNNVPAAALSFDALDFSPATGSRTYYLKVTTVGAQCNAYNAVINIGVKQR